MEATDVRDRFLTIESDGLGRGTKVLLPDGTDISFCVQGIRWELNGSGAAQVSLSLIPAKLITKTVKFSAVLDAMRAAGFEVRLIREDLDE